MKNQSRFLSCLAGVVIIASALCAAQAGSAGNAAPPAAVPAPASVQNTSATGTNPTFSQRDDRYRLRESDVFDISFELSPEYNQSGVTVQPDGYITLRSIGDVKVAGQTEPELVETLKMAYTKILHDPMISVILRDFQRPYFIADGQVGHPGKFELRGDVTLTQAVAMAGGFTEASKHSQVVLYRRVNAEWTSAKLYNLKEMENTRDLREDPVLHPGDMLFVPKNKFSKIRPFLPTTGVGVSTYAQPFSY
jgi:polysaccharide export outer membrane protein